MHNAEYEYAGFWIRVGATFIDVFLLSIILLPLTMMVYGDLTWKREGLILGPADFLINYVLPFVATILFWLYKSATPGKMALNMKVVDVDTGEKLSVGQSIGRYFAYIPAMAILMIGIIWVAFDKRKQGWHDKLAKTVVIRKRKK
ncbi:RDD family protein [bacterium endosymbiont of Bathymodiolus sp. 5 South]|uniref:RDD family protein n=1 Tax=bacterium endosymbiont of Bathymodiolus sp. 5 South TaxID=1181670 RepID=UPI001117CD23|nr:RDD family protein [bacterium endosymbiont of Bathymodiolus sp. 5 South]